MRPTYGGEWKNYKDVKAVYKDLPPASQLVYASYEAPGYEGSAIVVWKHGRKWFENNDSHCSCNGLDSWAPEETSPKALLMRKYPHWVGLGEAIARARRRPRRRADGVVR